MDWVFWLLRWILKFPWVVGKFQGNLGKSKFGKSKLEKSKFGKSKFRKLKFGKSKLNSKVSTTFSRKIWSKIEGNVSQTFHHINSNSNISRTQNNMEAWKNPSKLYKGIFPYPNISSPLKYSSFQLSRSLTKFSTKKNIFSFHLIHFQ